MSQNNSPSLFACCPLPVLFPDIFTGTAADRA
ncbi:hypothetical protein HMPREF1022_02342 [Desulfovibrio sp. 6_1_46AFAA]|nr:hypothetical protein HMPREF1022_02342 [Desulfovibrio sp. 6_1_46AFAA]